MRVAQAVTKILSFLLVLLSTFLHAFSFAFLQSVQKPNIFRLLHLFSSLWNQVVNNPSQRVYILHTNIFRGYELTCEPRGSWAHVVCSSYVVLQSEIIQSVHLCGEKGIPDFLEAWERGGPHSTRVQGPHFAFTHRETFAKKTRAISRHSPYTQPMQTHSNMATKSRHIPLAAQESKS